MLTTPTLAPTAPRARMPEAPSPSPAPTPTGDPAGFASLLRQSQRSEAAPALPSAPTSRDPAPESAELDRTEPDDATPPGDSVSDAAMPAHGADTPAKSRVAAKAKAARSTPAGPPEAAVAGADSRSGEGDKKPDAQVLPAADPAVMHWLASRQRGTAEPPRADAAARTPRAGKSGTEPAPTATTVDAPTSGAQPAANTDPGDRLAERRGTLATNRTAAEPGNTGARFSEALRGAAADTAPAPAAATLTAPATPTATLAATPTPVPTPAQPEPTLVTLATPVTAPDFAQELGLQLGVLARDGVQRAELHLNPAEMGPVSVQIVLDGTQAHVAFGADLAATRQAIEGGLPALASALQDAGFTLAGGGVSDQAAQRDGEPGQRHGDVRDPAAARVTDEPLPISSAATRRAAAAGRIDLFA